MSKVVTLGEIMLRLSPCGNFRLFQGETLKYFFGGSEANVAASLSRFGIDCSYITKLPKNAVGDAALNSLRYLGTDTSHIVRGGERVGIYFLENGISQRNNLCIYDRKNSAFATSKCSDFDWQEIFEGAEWFHFSGITPALSDETAKICFEACEQAKKRGMTISVDLNYRSKLWTQGKASNVMGELCKYADICISNDEEVYELFGILSKKNPDKEIDYESGYALAESLCRKFGFKTAALILRKKYSVHDQLWSGIITDNRSHEHANNYRIHIVDGVGGGDAFCAGLIYSVIKGKSMLETINFATAASALKYTVEGDINLVSADEVENIIK